ncbi:MAG: hypothetical protein ACD_9C00246G0003 [uncultured bacterium]|nr:MAG: hypothetical protein ACD_9C00246G0003 [uncultured bacterium]
MEYGEYIKKIKIYAQKSTLKQRILAVLIVLVILGGVVIYINPSRKLLEMRNAQRRSDVVNILNAVHQYGIEHEGKYPFVTTGTATMICRSEALSCEGLVDLSQILKDQKILLEIPVDPRVEKENISGYHISWLSNGRISVSAPLAENNAVISLSK